VSHLLLFAQESEPHDWLHTIAQPNVLVMFIPMIAIAGGIVFAITKAIISHRERISKIQQGIDPDAKHGAS
jgi:hypothetical protein